MATNRLKSIGYSLLELCVCLAILAILSIGAAELLQAGIKSEMISRSQQQQQALAMELFASLQNDLASAQNIAISGNQLSFQDSKKKTTITYSYGNQRISRAESGNSRLYPDPANVQNLSISCNSPCFQSVSNPITQISLNQLKIVDSQLDPITQPGLHFPIEQTTFNIVNGNEFF